MNTLLAAWVTFLSLLLYGTPIKFKSRTCLVLNDKQAGYDFSIYSNYLAVPFDA